MRVAKQDRIVNQQSLQQSYQDIPLDTEFIFYHFWIFNSEMFYYICNYYFSYTYSGYFILTFVFYITVWFSALILLITISDRL